MQIENEDPYKKSLNANEFYHNRAITRLEARHTCIPVQYFDDNGEELSQKILQIADYEGDSVTIVKKGRIMKLALDGTNFVSSISRAKEQDSKAYMYINKELGVEYRLIEEEIDQGMSICYLAKRVNDVVIAVNYCKAGDYFVVLKARQMDTKSNHTIEMQNKEYSEKDKSKLALYMSEMSSATDELLKESAIEELKEKYGEDSDEYQLLSENIDELMLNNNEDIEYEEDDESSYGLDDEGEYCNGVIYYDSKDYTPEAEKDDYLPQDVNDFSYSEYIKSNMKAINNNVKPTSENFREDVSVQKENNVTVSEESKKLERLYTEVMSTVFDTMVEEVDTEVFDVYINGQEINKNDAKEDVIMQLYQTVEIEHEEVQDLADSVDEIYNIVESAERIIRENKDKIITQEIDENER